MGILGIGVDILHVPRILRLINGPSGARLARRVLSDREYDTWYSFPPDDARKARFLAMEREGGCL
ncbi:hypothetical protein C8Q76DRAFT_721116 [Earliella scabrosa]|nr:hypothetical protein C8Q76DRAFT_721116 [Earliella scabrosa]